MQKVLSLALLALPAFAYAQGAQRALPAGQGPVVPAEAPVIAKPAAKAPQGHARLQPQMAPGAAPMPTPMPGGPLPAPIDLKTEALEKTAPLTPAEILELRRELDARSKAAAEPISPVGKPVRRLVTVDLSPGASPEIVRSAYGQGTVVNFLDAAGRPWAVEAAENFSPNGLDVAVLGANGVSIGVKSATARIGNIAVQLQGLSTPVIFAVAVGQQEIDYSVEMQLPKYIPGAPAPVGTVDALPSLNAPDLLSYLLGTIPKGARALESNALNVKAWQINSQTMIVRTDGLVASPRYTRRQSSANGMSVYELPVSPRLTIASQGQMQSVSISGFEATKEQK